mmetsp:Transcript_29593/g.66341  ORF Transcript_29593/g.66341 Transcript_29593/m.66341 type:complete len:90 (-) Transcript_29593:138-407(-)
MAKRYPSPPLLTQNLVCLPVCAPSLRARLPINPKQASDTEKFGRWHRGMLERGVYLAPSQYEAGFIGLAHTDEDVEKTIAAAKEVFAEL